MSSWIVRHDEALLEVKRTLAEAIQEYGPPGQSRSSRSWPMTTTGWSSSWGANSQQTGSASGDDHGQTEGTVDRQEDTREDSEAPNDDELIEEAGSESSWEQWHGGHWNWQRPTQWSSGSSTWSWDKSYYGRQTWDASATASGQADKFLPDFVVAWLLLQRSGLESSEKAVIVANLRNRFTTEKVKEALKLTWPDDELRKHDNGRQGAYLTAAEEAMVAEDADLFEPDEYEAENVEDQEAYTALEDEAQSAMAALNEARRTLKDAREKQSMMRRNRHFYTNSTAGSKNAGERPPIKCFRCGGPHLRRDCPKEPSDPRPKQANFVFSATLEQDAAPEPTGNSDDQACWAAALEMVPGQAHEEAGYLSLEDIVKQGKAIVDGGATSTLGSEEALKQIALLRWQNKGQDGIEILAGEQPSFRFGNNGRTTCMSTAMLDVDLDGQPGRMKIHLHDIAKQPVLMSIRALRALGAVVDYGRDEIILTQVNPRKVARLETTESGHQLFPLVGDALAEESERRTPFKSLLEEAHPEDLREGNRE